MSLLNFNVLVSMMGWRCESCWSLIDAQPEKKFRELSTLAAGTVIEHQQPIILLNLSSKLYATSKYQDR